MDPKCKASWTCACAAAVLIAGCDIDSFDRVPEVAARTQGHTVPGDAAIEDEAPSRTVDRVSDATLNARVEAALGDEPDLHGTTIGVRSDGGVVTLSGTTADPRLRSMAAEVALSVDGVHQVRNEITLPQDA